MNKKKKILICTEFFNPDIGGAQEISERIALINSEFHDVHILTSFHADRKKLQKNYYIHDFKVSGNYVRGIKGEKKKVLSFLNKEFFDQIIFYAAQQWTFDLFLQNEYLFNKKVKYFFIPCGFSKLNFLTYHFYFKKIIKISKYFEKIIFHSKYGNDYYFLLNKIQANQISIVKNGFKDEYFETLDIYDYYQIHPKAKIIPYISNFNYLKGQIRFLKILNKVNFKSPIYVIFFSKSKFYDKFFYYRFFLLYKKLFLNNKMIKVKIHFDAPKKYIHNTLNNSFLFLFCSRIEYSPLVIFEALQNNLPIVTFDVGDVSEVVKKNNFGFVVKKEKDFIYFLNKLLTDDLLYKSIKKNIKINKHIYNWSIIKEKYISIFK